LEKDTHRAADESPDQRESNNDHAKENPPQSGGFFYTGL
jgi:hypothetical protein